jgi:hypothetical protein
MDFDEFLYSRLAGAVGDLVGGLTGDFGSDFGSDFSHDDPTNSRIYPVVTEEDPASLAVVVYTVANEERITTLSGWTGWTVYTWGCKVAAKEFDDCKPISDGIKTAFHAVRSGQMLMSELVGSEDEAEEDGEAALFFTRTMSFKTTYQDQ